jgi:hypothetical protein
LVAVIVLAMLAGLGYLFRQNALNKPGGEDKSQSLAQAPTAPSSTNENKGTPPAPAPVTPPPTSAKQDTGTAKPSAASAGASEIDVADLPPPPTKPAPDPVVPAAPPKPPPEVEVPTKAPSVDIPAPAQPVATGIDPARIDAAIDAGIKYLKATQRPDGSWVGQGPETVGRTALGALALLECNQPPNDPAIQKAVKLIRNSGPTLTATYEAALAIMTLDRLGDPNDRPLIRSLALNLAAGQTLNGGWDYHWDRLTDLESKQVDDFLRTHWPWSRARPRPPELGSRPVVPGKQVTDGTVQLAQPPAKEDRPEVKKPPAKNPPDLPRIDLRNLPVNELVWNGFLNRDKAKVLGDNSNTQFGLLGLWVSRRHDVAAECPILLSYERFRRTQFPDGGFGYLPSGFGSTDSSNTMTCAGLMALAMGRAVVPAKQKVKEEDPAIAAGLKRLAAFIGNPSKDADARPAMENMYFLWSVERVGVLFDLKTIGKKDWYTWGAQILLANQHANGSWFGPKYMGGTNDDHVDTCFGLLFLKRANLAPDLTENIRLQMVIRDPGAR